MIYNLDLEEALKLETTALFAEVEAINGEASEFEGLIAENVTKFLGSAL